MLTIVVSVVSGRIGGQVLLHNIKKWSVQVVHKHHHHVQLTSLQLHHKQVYPCAMNVLTPSVGASLRNECPYSMSRCILAQ